MKSTLLIFFAGCSFISSLISCSEKKLEITNEYVINENWTRENESAGANSITISRMQIIPDSSVDPFSDLNQSEILSKLEKDTSFEYFANIKLASNESYNNRKIYFENHNGFYWFKENGEKKVKTIGKLNKNTWYRFSNLGTISIQYVFVYIDSLNKAHRFDAYHQNW